MTVNDVQRRDLAGKTKLTAVTLYHGSHRVQTFQWLNHDSNGKAVLPFNLLSQLQSTVGCARRGDTFSVG